MKKSISLILVLLLISCFTTELRSQYLAPQITRKGKGKVNTMIDNMVYWQQMVKLGYVTAGAKNTVPPAVFTGSRIKAKGIQAQDSPDICLTQPDGTTQSENSIFMNPGNGDELINSNNSTGWDGFNITDFFGADVRTSADAGATWGGQVEGVAGGNSGDPAVAIGTDGTWFVNKITNAYGQSVAWSNDHGTTWHDVVMATVPNPGSDLLDKNHFWIDNSPTSSYNGNLYNAFTIFVSSSPDNYQAGLIRSVDHGLTWSTPVNISAGVGGFLCQGVNLHTGPDGEVYAVFTIYDGWPSDETGIGFTKSLNGGALFTPATRAISNIRGVRTSGVTGKNMRVNSFPSMTVDVSNGPHRGNLYVVWTNIGVPGANSGPDIDVYMIRSTDQGASWSAPIKVNQDTPGLGKEHFIPWICSDPSTGNLCVIYYDDRNVSATEVETWISFSNDAGDTWTDMKVSDVAFTPTPISGLAGGYMGDYLGITLQDRMAFPVWTDNRNGAALTYTSPLSLGPAPNQPYVVYDSYDLSLISKGNRQTMDFGDSLHLSLGLKNIGDQPAVNVTAFLSADSPYITMSDSTELYGDLAVGETKSIANGYAFKVSDTIPDGLNVKFNVRAVDADSTWYSTFRIEAHAPGLHITNVVIRDSASGNNNGRLDPGESVTVAVTLENTGDFPCAATWIKISSPSDYLTFGLDSVFVGDIAILNNQIALFPLTVSADACLYSSADLHLVAGSGLYRSKKTALETIGLLMEDWETGNFSKFPWSTSGDANWFIDNSEKYEGTYSARAGVITDSQSSSLQLTYTSGADDSISFYRKVSSENSYDFLRFYIDGLEQGGGWSGEVAWGRAAFPVSAGTHTFKWEYSTDVYVLNGSNTGWIDNISFPAPPLPDVYAGNDTTLCAGQTLQLHGTVSAYDSVRWTTYGDGTFSNDTIISPIYTPGANDISSGLVKLRLKANGANGCYASSLHLTLAPLPVPGFTILPDDTVCAGLPIHLFADPVAGGHYLWTPGGYTTSDITVDTSMTHGFGSRWFKLRVTNAANCVASDSVRITFKDCTGIGETEAGTGIGIYPNPNDGSFTLKIRNHIPGHVNIYLQNALNVVIFEEKDVEMPGNLTRTYKLNTLPRGIYVLTVEDHDVKTNLKMIVR